MGSESHYSKNSGQYELPINYDIDQIMTSADCSKTNPNYNKYLGVLNELILENIKYIHPIAYVLKEDGDAYTMSDAQGVINCLVTVGRELDTIIKDCFDRFDYLEGMFITLIGDSVLFEASNHLYQLLKQEIVERDQYLSVRMAPGDIEVGMEVQGEIFNKIQTKFQLDMFMTEGYMISPSKSLAYFYRFDDQDRSGGIDHTCDRCTNTGCKNRGSGCINSISS